MNMSSKIKKKTMMSYFKIMKIKFVGNKIYKILQSVVIVVQPMEIVIGLIQIIEEFLL